MDRIPKIIHWCWFGEKRPPRLTKKCLQSWRRYLPDYRIVFWNESNFDLNQNRYVQEAYAAKKYAFVSDYVRLWVLHQMGGIYLDSDLEVVRSLDGFLRDSFFIGYEPENLISTCIIGATPNHPWIGAWLKDYENRIFKLPNGGDIPDYDTTPNTQRVTELLTRLGFRPDGNRNGQFTFEGEKLSFYAYEYFPPKHYLPKFRDKWDHTYAIHHMKASWRPLATRLSGRTKKFIRGHLSVKQYDILRKVKRIVKGKVQSPKSKVENQRSK